MQAVSNRQLPGDALALSAATAITSILIALHMVRVDLILVYGLPDFGQPDFLLLDFVLHVGLLVRIFLVLIGHRNLLLLPYD